MQFELKGVGFHVSEDNRQFVTEKLNGLKKFESGIESLSITVAFEGDNVHKLKADIHFHWKHTTHLSCEDRELYNGIDHLFQEIETKCRREKEKIKDHHRGAPPL